MTLQTIRKKRPMTARKLAAMYDVSPRTIVRWNSQTRQDWINDQADLRESIRVYHDDEGHSWNETVEHFNMSSSAVRQRCYRARKERAAEAEERAKNEVHKNEVPLF